MKAFWRSAILGRDCDTVGPEYVELVSDPEGFDKNESVLSPSSETGELDAEQGFDIDTVRWANDVHRQHRRRPSAASEGTLYGSPTCMRSIDNIEDAKGTATPTANFIRQVGNGIFAVLERFLVFAAFGQLLTGVVVYTGMAFRPWLYQLLISLPGGCRQNYINGCLAHLISASLHVRSY